MKASRLIFQNSKSSDRSLLHLVISNMLISLECGGTWYRDRILSLVWYHHQRGGWPLRDPSESAYLSCFYIYTLWLGYSLSHVTLISIRTLRFPFSPIHFFFLFPLSLWLDVDERVNTYYACVNCYLGADTNEERENYMWVSVFLATAHPDGILN